MPIFFSPHADVILSVLSCVLVLTGATCLVVAGEKSLDRPFPTWKYLGWACLALAAWEWLGSIALTEQGFARWRPLTTALPFTASVLTLLAARAELAANNPRKKIFRIDTILPPLVLAGIVIALEFSRGEIVRGEFTLADIAGAPLVLLAKMALACAAVILFDCTLRNPDRSRRGNIFIPALFFLHAAFILVSRTPGLPETMGGVSPAQTYVHTGLFLLRAATAALMTLLMWDAYSRAVGVTGQIRWWPIAIIFFFLGLAATFVVISARNHGRIIRSNLISSAKAAAATLNPIPLLIAADDPAAADNPRILNAVFGRTREQEYYNGYARYRFQIDAVALPTNFRRETVAVIDRVAHPDGGAWLAASMRAVGDDALFGTAPVLREPDSGRFEPFIATAPVTDADGSVLGAAAMTVPAADVANDLYLFKRPLLLLLPAAFAVLLLFFSRQLRVWMLNHSNSRANLRQLLDALPMSVCYIDRDEIVRLCDRDFCREAGAESPDELIGRPYSEVGPYGVFYRSEDMRMLRGEGGDYSDIDFALTKNGVTRNFKVRRIVLRDAGGEVRGLVKAFQDTTEFVAASHEAKKAERAKAAFLANMSHELRTPMNGIVGMADLIIDHEGGTPVQRLYAETIIKSAKTLQMVIEEVMDIAAVDDVSRRLTPAPAPFPLLTLTEEAVQIAGCIVEARGVNLHLSYDFGLHSMCRGDARRVKQILVQLLTHCARLTSNGKITLEVARAGGGRVSFRAVFPPPPDIFPEDIQNLFRRPEYPAAGVATDSGLGFFDDRAGVPLLWRLIRKMEGELEVKSIVGGVACDVTLPLDREGAGVLPTPPLLPPDLGGIRVLAAVRDSARFEVARACLEFAGALVERACDRESAHRMLARGRKAGDPYDMAVIDGGLAEEEEMRAFLRMMRTAELGDPPVMLIVTPRQVQGLSGMAGNIRALLLPPVLPSEAWYKAKTILSGGSPVPATGVVSRGTTTVTVRKRSTRAARLVRIPAKVLLVEDNVVNQMVAMGILQRIGCEATLAKNGREAVDAVADGGTYDLILMDCLMPVMDGYEATSRIRMRERTDSNGKRNTIVALTANSVPGDKEKCLAAGMDGYIAKPVTMDAVRETVAKYCPGLVTMVDEDGDSR